MDLFLKIDGIAGESTDKAHRGELDASAFSWGEHVQVVPTGGAGGGAGVGKVTIGDLQVVLPTSLASPLLMVSCASGRHHATAKLTVRRDGKVEDLLVIKLQDVMITSYRAGVNESDTIATDQISLAFQKIEMTVTSIGPKGGPGQSVRAGWDVDANVPTTAPIVATPRGRGRSR